MSTKIQLTYCGMSGEGETVKLAKQNAASRIEAALSGYYTPFMIRHGDMIGFVWREPTGYAHRIIYPDAASGPVYGNHTMSFEDGKTAISYCAWHMAQNAGTYAGLEAYLSRAQIRDLDTYFAWQERYRSARSAGKSDDEARIVANQ